MLEKMKEIIAGQLNVNAEDVKPESRFKEDLNADSLDLFELVMALEDEYSVEIQFLQDFSAFPRAHNRLYCTPREFLIPALLLF